MNKSFEDVTSDTDPLPSHHHGYRMPQCTLTLRTILHMLRHQDPTNSSRKSYTVRAHPRTIASCLNRCTHSLIGNCLNDQ